MKYMKQFGIILVVSFLGELLHEVIPLLIPASIYGLILMLLALIFKIIKLEQVKETGDFLIKIMPLMFIPSAVGLLDAWPVLQPFLIPLMIILIVTTLLVMLVSGKVTQILVDHKKGGNDHE